MRNGRLLRSTGACALFLVLSLPGSAHEIFVARFTSEPEVPIAYHPRRDSLWAACAQFIRLTARPSQWRTLALIEAGGLRKLATRLHLYTPAAVYFGPRNSAIDNCAYQSLKRLQQRRWLEAITFCYECNRTGKPHFTRYEVAVLLARRMEWFTWRCTDRKTGVEWESCQIYRGLSYEDARDFYDLYREFAPELQELGVPHSRTMRLLRTLNAYQETCPKF